MLKGYLLTEEEYELGPGSWKHFKDPMPSIEFDNDDDAYLKKSFQCNNSKQANMSGAVTLQTPLFQSSVRL